METAPLADKIHTAHDPSCDKDIIFMATSCISQEVGMSMHMKKKNKPLQFRLRKQNRANKKKVCSTAAFNIFLKWNNSDHNCQYGLNIHKTGKTSGNRGTYIKEQKYKTELSYLPRCNCYHMWSEADSSCAC